MQRSDALKNLQIEAKARRGLIADQQKQLQKKQEKVSSIETNICLLSSRGNASQVPFVTGGSFLDDGDDSDDDISDDDDNDDDDNDNYSGDLYESSGNVKPVWDQADGVFRCKECAFEVVDGVCHACGTEFK